VYFTGSILGLLGLFFLFNIHRVCSCEYGNDPVERGIIYDESTLP
jgi:hypothetical protein